MLAFLSIKENHWVVFPAVTVLYWSARKRKFWVPPALFSLVLLIQGVSAAVEGRGPLSVVPGVLLVLATMALPGLLADYVFVPFNRKVLSHALRSRSALQLLLALWAAPLVLSFIFVQICELQERLPMIAGLTIAGLAAAVSINILISLALSIAAITLAIDAFIVWSAGSLLQNAAERGVTRTVLSWLGFLLLGLAGTERPIPYLLGKIGLG